MRKVYLDNLPKINHNNIFWKESVGYKVKFVYDDISGQFEIVDYQTNGVAPKVYIIYEKCEGWITSASLAHAKLGRFLKAPQKCKRNIINVVGQRFGKLTVIEDDGTRSDTGQILWKCLCDCGEYTYSTSYKLRKGLKSSCGCDARKYFKPKQKSDYEKRNTAISIMLGRYKSKAKTRKLVWNISKEKFIKTIESQCYYCGTESSMEININGYLYKHNGIDRVDSHNGYEDSNIVPCCRWCNQAKSMLSQSEFYNWVQKISKNFTYDKVS